MSNRLLRQGNKLATHWPTAQLAKPVHQVHSHSKLPGDVSHAHLTLKRQKKKIMRKVLWLSVNGTSTYLQTGRRRWMPRNNRAIRITRAHDEPWGTLIFRPIVSILSVHAPPPNCGKKRCARIRLSRIYASGCTSACRLRVLL